MRRVLELASDYNNREIAEVLSQEEGKIVAVKGRLNRARKKAAELFAEEDRESS